MVYVNEEFQRQVCQTDCGMDSATRPVLIEVEVSENWLPWLKSVSATKGAAAAPPALMAVTRLPEGGGFGVGEGVGEGVGPVVGEGVGEGVGPVVGVGVG